MFTVTVLTPKGRRQQVKVTPNTTLLQVLEEVCAKHGFRAEEYDLRHHNKVLDLSSMFRFTNLPNNAQLEMSETIKQRQESPVTLGLQLESGERLTGVFSPSDSIWNVIVTLKPDEETATNLVVVYMRQEIYGNENLKVTTLRSLGLTGGRAVLRLLHKSPEELKTQANVSANLTPRMSTSEKLYYSEPSNSEVVKREMSVEKPKTPSPGPVKKNTSSPEPIKKPTLSPEPNKKETSSSKYSHADNINLGSGNVFEKLLKDEKMKRSLLDSKKTTGSTETSKRSSHLEAVKENSIPEAQITNNVGSQVSVSRDKTHSKEESKVIFLGERNAVAYNLNSVKPREIEEEPDDFYDLTVSDAKLLLQQAKQLCADLEDAPLMTAAQRELEKDKRVLSLLHQYKKTVLRIKFPDRTVLQGTFSPTDTVGAVERFVTEYLAKPHLKFYLYTTPPKVVLKSEEYLIECGCVPCSVLYFGLPPNVTPPSQYLKSDVLEKLSTPSAAALTAYQSRGMDRKLPEDPSLPEEAEKRKWSKNAANPEPGPSSNKQWESKPRDNDSSPQFKVPKWFRTNK